MRAREKRKRGEPVERRGEEGHHGGHQKLLQIAKHFSFSASFYKNRFDKNCPKST
jgi:hypothetical protein